MKGKVSRLLFVYLSILLIAAIFKLDYFPLTWAPMYSGVIRSDDYKITSMNRSKVRGEGFLAKHRDGTTSNITYKDLNVLFRNFWPLYSQRIYHVGPPGHRFARNEFGTYNTIEVDWETRLFETINRTLGYDENNPKFIIELTTSKNILYFTNTKSDLTIKETLTDTITIKWGAPIKDLLKAKPHLLRLDE